MSKKQVQVGQVFQTIGSSSARSWRVTDTLNVFGIPHARVVSIEGDGDTKTLSCLVLTDSDFYRVIDTPAKHAAA